MSSSTLFAINSIGRVYHIKTCDASWKPITYLGVDFIKIVSSKNFVWGIGCDHRLYVYVFDLGVPIRVKEECFENERWKPAFGFSSSLLPTDRYNFSNEEGTEKKCKDEVLLPSMAWSWDSNWTIEEYLDSHPLGKEGWMYSVDFPATYLPEKQWNSFVRRRKWYRYRKYVAENSWSSVKSLHADDTKEPFCDIAIGGWNIPGCTNGAMCVWAVTAMSRIIFRCGVNAFCPEGTHWLAVDVPQDCDVRQINANSSGELWAVCWDGKLLARIGVVRNRMQGSDWVHLISFPNLKFSSVTLGEKSAWGVDRDYNIWYHALNKSYNEEVRWIQICGKMTILSIGVEDQVFGISSEDGCLYVRKGISPKELSGQAWAKVICDIDSCGEVNDEARVNLSRSEGSSEVSLESLDARDSESSRANLHDNLTLSDLTRSWRCVAAGSLDFTFENAINRWTVPDFTSTQLLDGPWKSELKELLISRNQNECEPFPEIPHLVEQSSWIKSGKCKYFVSVLNSWVDATVELDWSGKKTDKYEDGMLCIFYKSFMLEKVMLRLEEITCIIPIFEKSLPSILIYNEKTTSVFNPYRIQFSNSGDCSDWLSTLTLGCSTVRDTFGKAADSSLWITTSRGDVFVHHMTQKSQVPEKLYWQLYGGHLSRIETCSKGITWGISYDHDLWVYTKGYGGGVLKGSAECKALLNTMTDFRNIYIYENQRWNPVSGYTTHGLPTDRHSWSDKSGLQNCSKENMELPAPQWVWAGDWAIDYNVSGGVDEDGWQYAVDFPMPFHSHKGLTDYVRRRRWVRKCQLITTGPWLKPDKMKVLDVSLKVLTEKSQSNQVMAWCVSTEGQVIHREGVTLENHAGTSWTHLPVDHNIVSLSISTNGKLWAITSSGSAVVRIGISDTNALGNQWIHVEPPPKARLKYVSAGKNEVWAIDRYNNLYRRDGITDTFPQGTGWCFVTSFIRDLSVSGNDQVWCILEQFPFEAGSISGILALRSGISADTPAGEGWSLGLGGGVQSISARGT